MPPEPTVVVTGASSGIGAATVEMLVRSGWSVWAAVRRQEDADRVIGRYGSAVRPLLMDLGNDADIERAGAAVCDDGPLQALVNCAGVALTGPLETLSLAALRELLDINAVAQLAVTQAMLPALRAGRALSHRPAETVQPGRPRQLPVTVVMIGSIGDRVSMPMLGAYAASKHALAGLTGALAAELQPSAIRVVLIEPGATATRIWTTDRAAEPATENSATVSSVDAGYASMRQRARSLARRNTHHGMPPERVAAVVVNALTAPNPSPRQLVGRSATSLAMIQRLLPSRLFDRLIRSAA